MKTWANPPFNEPKRLPPGLGTRGDKPSRSPRVALRLSIAFMIAGAPAQARAETLLEAIETAGQISPRIQATEAGVRASKAALRGSVSGYLPKLSATADSGRRNDRYYYPDNTSEHFNTTPRGYGFQFQQALFDGGKTLATIRSSKHLLDASSESSREMSQQVLFDAALAYLDYLQNSEIFKLENRYLSFLLAQKATINDLFNFGEVTATDVSQVETRVDAARARVAMADANQQASRARYVEIIGYEPGALVAPRPLDALAPKSLEDCIALALNRNPALLAARATASSAHEQVNVNEADYLPNIKLIASMSDRHDGAQLLGYNRATSGAVFAQLNVPIFEGGATVSRVSESREIAYRKSLEADANMLRVKAAATASWYQYVAAKAKQAATEKQVNAAVAAFKGVRQEFFIGQRTTSMLLDAVREMNDAGIALIAAHRDRVLSSFAVARDIGTLDEEAVRTASMGQSGPSSLAAQLRVLDIPAKLRLDREPLELRGKFDMPCIENCDTAGAGLDPGFKLRRDGDAAPLPAWKLR